MNKNQLAHANAINAQINGVKELITNIEKAQALEQAPFTAKRDPANYGISLCIGGRFAVRLGVMECDGAKIHPDVISDKDMMELVDRNNITLLKLLKAKLEALETELKTF